MKLIKCIALFLITGFSAEAQKYELGEVTKEELEEKAHPLDASAPAAILFSKGHTYFAFSDNEGFQLVTEVEMKIKIYTKEGYDWGTKHIQYYSSDNDRETVDVSKAVTYNLVEGSVKKAKLKSEGEFTEQLNKYWKVKKIVMPEVKEGSIVEFRYTIRSPFIHVFPDWRFQESIPVNHSEYITKSPEYFMFNTNFRGYYAPKVTVAKNNRSLMMTSKERSENTVTSTTFENNKIDYLETETSYVLDNLPALKGETHVNNILNYAASVEHELSMIKYPNQPVKALSTNWEDVARTIYKMDNFGPELNKTGYFEDNINALLAGITSPAEKASAIFSYVKNRMNWNDYTGYACEAGVRKAYNEKVGNIADINLMLTAMLRFAGLDANPVLVSTRSNKIALFPNTSAFNYVIASVNVEGKTVLLDATSKAAMPNILPIRALNWTGRQINKDGSSVLIDLMPGWISREVVNMAVQLDAEGKVTGKAREQYFDYNALMFRENVAGLNEESYIERMEKHYNGLEINAYKVTNDDMSKPVMEEYDFVHKNVSDVIGDKIFISPMMFLSKTENPFKQEKREYPIDFIYPSQDKYLINIVLPEGYVVESMPQSVAMAMEENIGSFKYNIAQTDNKIQLSVVVDINYATVSPDYYLTIRDFYQKMIEKQGEKIVLKKA